MNYTEQRAAIEGKFFNGWDSVATPIKFDNSHGLRKGNTVVDNETKLKEWCSIEVVNQAQVKAAFNIKMTRHTGTIFVTVFTEIGKGSVRVRELADKIADVMQSTNEEQVILYPAELRMTGPTPDSSFWQGVIEIPFQVDQYRS